MSMETTRTKVRSAWVRRPALMTAVAAAMIAGTLVGSTTPAGAASGDTTEFALPAGSVPYDIASGPDGNLWVTGFVTGTISRMTPTGGLTSFTTPTANSQPREITAGPDGNVWFTESNVGKVGRISMAGVITEFPLSAANAMPMGIAAGPDGAMWFTEFTSNKIGRITTDGVVTEFALPTAGSGPAGIAAGPTGSNRMYFTQALGNRIGIVTTSGDVTNTVSLPFGVMPLGIATIAGSVWFVELNSNSLSHLVSDTTVARISLGAGAKPTDVTAGPGSTMWVSAGGTSQVLKIGDQGNLIGTYPTPTPAALPQGLTMGPDGNIWVALTGVNKVSRVASGQVPVSTGPPEVGPVVGIVPGTVMTSAPGSWSYQPTAYAYQWQRCTAGVGDCADIAGATTTSYTVTVEDDHKYLRLGVIATNASGSSPRVFTGLVPVGVPPTPPKPQPPAPATGPSASIGNGATAVLVTPGSQRRGRSSTYRVVFSAAADGTVTLSFTAKGRSKTVKGIAVKAGQATYRWKTPWSWRKGMTTVRASFTPVLGSAYTAANMIGSVKIK